MKLFFEDYIYNLPIIQKSGLSQYFYISEKYDEAKLISVGYFYAPEIQDVVFILPKIFLGRLSLQKEIRQQLNKNKCLPVGRHYYLASFFKYCFLFTLVLFSLDKQFTELLQSEREVSHTRLSYDSEVDAEEHTSCGHLCDVEEVTDKYHTEYKSERTYDEQPHLVYIERFAYLVYYHKSDYTQQYR